MGAFSDIPSCTITPSKPKRKGSTLGLDPKDLTLRSPKCVCKKQSPLPTAAKQVHRCEKHHWCMFLFLVFCYSFKFVVYVWFVCACMHSPDVLMLKSGHYDILAERWTAQISPVDLGWRIEKCSRFSRS